ncbi:MAG: trypsin-like peptidase domain-containing protein [Christensenellales bacterium]
MDNEKMPEDTTEGESRAEESLEPAQNTPENNDLKLYPQYNNMRFDKPPRKKKRGIRVFVALMLIVCLLGGTVFGTLVVAPNVDKISRHLFGEAGDRPSPTPELNTQPAPEMPQIGGPAPQIYPSAKGEFVQIAKTVGPTVVGISTSADKRVGRQTREVVISSGSGFIIKPDGYIVTNYHVISEGDYIDVTLYEGTVYRAKLIGFDSDSDLAVIKIEAQGLTAAPLGDSDALEVGEKVIAIGNPLGENAGSVTSGIISGLNRELTGFSLKYIQTDAAFNPGNSGGPLVDMNARVIGINTLKSTHAGFNEYGLPIGSEGLGYAIPISTAMPIIQQLIATGSVPRPFIGIECVVDTTGLYNPIGEAPLGVTVVTVIKDGPADHARIAPGDIILVADGTQTETIQALLDVIGGKKVGDKLNVTVWRSGQEYITTVTIGDKNKM